MDEKDFQIETEETKRRRGWKLFGIGVVAVILAFVTMVVINL